MGKKIAERLYWIKDGGENKELLKRLYPTATRAELEKAFPERNWQAIKRAANNFGFERLALDGWNEELNQAIAKAFKESCGLDAKERRRAKFRLINRLNKLAAKYNLRPKSWGTVLKHANGLGLSWGAQENAADMNGEPAKNLWDQDVLLAFLSAKRTTKELEKHFGESIEAIEPKLPAVIGKYELVSYRNSNNGKSYFYREKLSTNGAPPERVWQRLPVTESEEGSEQSGGILLKFPDELDWRQIRILPLAEAHIGSPLHLKERFGKYLALGKLPYYYFVVNGSVFALPPQGKMEVKMDFLQKIRADVLARLRPVAHKILWAHQGCTEGKIQDMLHYDPLEDVCQTLGIPYFARPVFAVVLWKGHAFSFYCIHGQTTARKLGSMINPVVDLLNQFDFVHFVVMSHQRSGMGNVVPRCVRDRTNARLDLKNQHLIVTPSFVRYSGSIEERKGHAPPARGSHAMILFPDGVCAASS